MFDPQGSSHPPHFPDSEGDMIYSKTGQGSEESLCFLDLLCDSGHCSVFPFEISKSTELAGSFHSRYERATSSSLEEMSLREVAAE